MSMHLASPRHNRNSGNNNKTVLTRETRARYSRTAPRKKRSNFTLSPRAWPVFTSHQSRVTSHSYFFGLDSGGTNPDTR